MSPKEEYILCAAIYVYDQQEHVHQPKNIDLGYVVCGRRHHNCITTLRIVDKKWKQYPYSQGFLTSKDRFIERQEAAELALQSGQIEIGKIELFSEDLY